MAITTLHDPQIVAILKNASDEMLHAELTKPASRIPKQLIMAELQERAQKRRAQNANVQQLQPRPAGAGIPAVATPPHGIQRMARGGRVRRPVATEENWIAVLRMFNGDVFKATKFLNERYGLLSPMQAGEEDAPLTPVTRPGIDREGYSGATIADRLAQATPPPPPLAKAPVPQFRPRPNPVQPAVAAFGDLVAQTDAAPPPPPPAKAPVPQFRPRPNPHRPAVAAFNYQVAQTDAAPPPAPQLERRGILDVVAGLRGFGRRAAEAGGARPHEPTIQTADQADFSSLAEPRIPSLRHPGGVPLSQTAEGAAERDRAAGVKGFLENLGEKYRAAVSPDQFRGPIAAGEQEAIAGQGRDTREFATGEQEANQVYPAFKRSADLDSKQGKAVGGSKGVSSAAKLPPFPQDKPAHIVTGEQIARGTPKRVADTRAKSETGKELERVFGEIRKRLTASDDPDAKFWNKMFRFGLNLAASPRANFMQAVAESGQEVADHFAEMGRQEKEDALKYYGLAYRYFRDQRLQELELEKTDIDRARANERVRHHSATEAYNRAQLAETKRSNRVREGIAGLNASKAPASARAIKHIAKATGLSEKEVFKQMHSSSSLTPALRMQLKRADLIKAGVDSGLELQEATRQADQILRMQGPPPGLDVGTI